MLAFFGGRPRARPTPPRRAASCSSPSRSPIAWAKDGIRVNAVAPGWIVTPLTERRSQHDEARSRVILDRTPMGRWGTPEDVVGPALFLASDAARFVTGVVLPVDGGYSSM